MATPIATYTEAVNKSFDDIDAALDTASTSFTGITDDVAFLKETIDKLQNNPGPISAEDQALLDAAQARASGLVTKTSNFKTALETLDAATTRPAPPA